MRTRLAGLAAAATVLAALAVPAEGAAPRYALRGVADSYSQPGGIAPITSGTGTILTPGPWEQVGASEDHVQVAGHDTRGVPIEISLDYQPSTSSGQTTTLVCGSSGMIAVAKGSQVRVTPVIGRCSNGTVSLPTSGTISLTFRRTLPPPPKPISKIIPATSRWAVLVGIQHYSGNTHPTIGGNGDLDAIRTSLIDSGWRADHILVLRDGQATGQAIINAMDWLARHSSASTYSLFHFSGHACIESRGPCAAGHTYLWGYDNRFVSEDTVTSVLGRVKGHAWFDFAACESGAFDNGLHSALRLVTAASQPHETAYEDPDWHESIWTGVAWDQAFLQGKAERPHKASIRQMIAYGQSEAARLTGKQAKGPQHPYAAGGDPTESLYAPHV